MRRVGPSSVGPLSSSQDVEGARVLYTQREDRSLQITEGRSLDTSLADYLAFDSEPPER